MKQETRDRWCAALRSGRFKKTCGTFGEPGSKENCVLGVLAVVLKMNPAKVENGETPWHEVLGLPDARTSIQCWQMNDTTDKSFPEMADWIEANVPVEPSADIVVAPEKGSVIDAQISLADLPTQRSENPLGDYQLSPVWSDEPKVKATA